MSDFVKRHPVLSLALLAMLFGVLPIWAVQSHILTDGFSQLGALSASAAAFVLAATQNGWAGVRELFGRALIWRVNWRWWASALLFPVLPSVAALYVFSALGGPAPDWSNLKPIWTVVPIMVVLIVLAGFGEEFGWRGFALPRLQQRSSPLAASVIIGTVWGIWHIPLFLTDGTVQSEWLAQGGWLVAVGGYTAFCIAWSIQYTWVFNSTGGSVLLAAVMHGAGNAWFGSYIDVYRGHLGGIIVFMALMAAFSALLVALNGPGLSRQRN